MRRFLLTGAIALCVLLGISSDCAARSGDMFDDQGISVANRPWVPSDQYEGYQSHPDMFPEQAPYVRTDKDMFDSVRPPGNPGIEEEFSAPPGLTAPPDTLFHNPNAAEQ